MRAEFITEFEQDDENSYVLTWEDDDGGKHALSMDTFEATRLYSLLRKRMEGYVQEMEQMRAEYLAATDEERESVLHGVEDEAEMLREQGDLLRKARRENQ